MLGFVAGGFVAGWAASRRLTVSTLNDLRQVKLSDKGDAPQPVRAGVLQAMTAFQEGYTRRDPKQLDAFMRQLFPQNEYVLLLGTEASEWRIGYDSIARFIQADWLRWGDVRLSVEDSVICSSGDAIWLATVGRVGTADSYRPIRFTAVMTRRDARWWFRQVHFQWDDPPLRLQDLLSLRTLSKLKLR